MTPRGKFIVTLLLLTGVTFGVVNWWEVLRPSPHSAQIQSTTAPRLNPARNSGNFAATPEAESAEILPRTFMILFRPNQAELDAAYDPEIPAVLNQVSTLATRYRKARFVIVGHTDASHRELVAAESLQQLSLARAAAVKKALLKRVNVEADRVQITAHGADEPFPGAQDPASAETNNRNRRVVIHVFPLEHE